MSAPARAVAIIACGALARELTQLLARSRFAHIRLFCLPAWLHNHPDRIPEAVRAKIRALRPRFSRIFVAYADCGTAGALDRVLLEEGVERLSGPHCYAFYAGAEVFQRLHEEEPATFYLTDYLVRHFDRLIIQGLGLDRHPQLLSAYFGNYRRLVYLAQSRDGELLRRARRAAERLGLAFEHRHTGFGELARFVERAREAADGRADDPVLAGHSGPGAGPGGEADGAAALAAILSRRHRPRRHARRTARQRRLSRRLAEGRG